MEHNQRANIEPINISSSIFGVEYENQFVVLEDSKHVIGVDPNDGRNLIFENVETQKAFKFRCSESTYYLIVTLVYVEKTGSLYTGDRDGHLQKYKIDEANKTFQKVKNYGKIGIDLIYSSQRFLHLVFFGGNESQIKVLDLSTSKLLPGRLETAIEYIYSIQVCVISHNQIYLAVFGTDTHYSDDKTDLFEVSGLLLNSPVVIKNYLFEFLFDEYDTFRDLRSTIKSQKETIHRLTQKRDSYKDELKEMLTKYNDLKESQKKDLN